MLRHDEDLVTNTEERGAIGMLQREYNGAAIRRCNTLDYTQNAVLIKGGILLHQVKGELDVSTRERLAIIPFHVCAQLERQLRQIGGVCSAAGQPGRGLAGIQVGEVELFIEQTLRAIVATLVGIKEWVKEIRVGLPGRRENTKCRCMG